MSVKEYVGTNTGLTRAVKDYITARRDFLGSGAFGHLQVNIDLFSSACQYLTGVCQYIKTEEDWFIDNKDDFIEDCNLLKNKAIELGIHRERQSYISALDRLITAFGKLKKRSDVVCCPMPLDGPTTTTTILPQSILGLDLKTPEQVLLTEALGVLNGSKNVPEALGSAAAGTLESMTKGPIFFAASRLPTVPAVTDGLNAVGDAIHTVGQAAEASVKVAAETAVKLAPFALSPIPGVPFFRW